MIVKGLDNGKWIVWNGWTGKPIDDKVFDSMEDAEKHLDDVMEQEHNKELCQLVSEINIVRTNMEKYGGSFMKGLATALLHADINNALKIKMAWAFEWDTYLNWDNRG